MQKNQKSTAKKAAWITIIVVLVILGLVSVMIAGIIGLFIGVSGPEPVKAGNVAVIEIQGILVTAKTPSFTAKNAVSTEIAGLIEKADKNPGIKAIVLSINTPGGSAVASDEIAEAIQASNKTSVAMIRDIGTSGGYWIASSADYIVAHPASFTGSIGVIGSRLEFAGFLDDYNITYRRLVAGKYKDIGTPYKEMTSEEEAIFQESLDELHELFIAKVAEGRSMPVEKVRGLATGQFYTGARAKQLGLVDELGGRKEVKAYLKNRLNADIMLVEYKKPLNFFERLAESFSNHGFQIGKGLASGMKEDNEIMAQI